MRRLIFDGLDESGRSALRQSMDHVGDALTHDPDVTWPKFSQTNS